jgi:hypothetical protein
MRKESKRKKKNQKEIKIVENEMMNLVEMIKE